MKTHISLEDEVHKRYSGKTLECFCQLSSPDTLGYQLLCSFNEISECTDMRTLSN
jgi:hypothetical protein